MAKAPAPPKTEAPAAAPPAPGRGKKLLIVVVTLVVVAMLLLAGLAGLVLMKKAKGADGETVAAFDVGSPPTFVPLEPFVANLAPDEGERYLQVVLALKVGDEKTGERVKGFMPELRHHINLILTSKLPSDLSTADGREDLADEIVRRTNTVLRGTPAKDVGGPVQAVLFNSFIIQ